MTDRDELSAAVECALAGNWEDAHTMCQQFEGNRTADWLHAVLHKIEGDEANARYWYRRAGQSFEAWSDPTAELRAIKAVLTY